MRHLPGYFAEMHLPLQWRAAVTAVFRAALGFALASIIYVGVTLSCLYSFIYSALYGPAPLTSPSELPDRRSDYRELSVSPEDQWCLADWHSSESWTQDPREVGLCFAGYPNIDGVDPDIVRVFYPEPGKVIVVVIGMGLMDDSIEAQKIRVDLAEQEGTWRVEWAGGQWRCQPGRGHRFWDASFCA